MKKHTLTPTPPTVPAWELVKLGEICSQDRRIVAPSSQNAKRLSYLGLEDLESQTGRVIRFERDLGDSEGKSTTFAFDNRHVLYGKLRPYLNKVAIPNRAGRCTTEIVPLLPREGVNRQFLAWLLRRPQTVAAVMREKTGARMPRADMNVLLGMTVPLPPLPEQKRIVAILTEQMAAVEKARIATEAQLEAARSLPNALYRVGFQGIIPLDVREVPRSAPAGWKWQKLTDLARLESGHTPSRNHPEWWGGDVPWIGLSDIRALDGITAMETKEYTNKLGLENSSARLLPANTVALCRTASVGMVTIMGRPMSTSQHFADWVCGTQLDSHFLLHLFQASRGRLNELASGSTIQDIYMNTIRNFRVCIPHLPEQRKLSSQFADCRQSVDRLMANQRLALVEAERLPATLLERAFSGEL